MRLNRIIWILVLGLMLPSLSLQAAGKKASKKKQKTEQTTEEKKTSTYDKLFKDKSVKTVKGFITLHMVDGKLIMEFPKAFVGRDMLIGSTIEEISDAGEGAVGMQPEKPLHIRISATDSLVLVHKMVPRVIADAEPQVQAAIEKSNISPIIASFPIECLNPDSSAYVFDATSLFVGDNDFLIPYDRRGANSLGGFISSKLTFVNNKSMLADVAAYGDNVAITSLLSYSKTSYLFGAFLVDKAVPFTALAKRSIMLLPEATMRPRLADSRIGVKYSEYIRYASDEQGSKPVYYANRWNLQPAARQTLGGNKLVDPEKPIVFYLDPRFPTDLAQSIKTGVEKWNVVFEKLGYKNVVRVVPYPENDKNFDPDDVKFSCIKYVTTTEENVRNNVWCDPRSGEIISASIYVPYNILSGLHAGMFLQLAAADPDIRSLDHRQESVMKGLEAQITRSVGDCLGLAANYAASYAIPADSLRSPSFTREYGLSSSIMDYLPYNFFAKPGDKERGVVLVHTDPGVYDQFAIEWLYGAIPEAKTPEEELPVLDALIRSKAGNPMYFYTKNQSRVPIDPRTLSRDLGNDALKAADARCETLKYVIANADKWLNQADSTSTFRRLLLSQIYMEIYYTAQSVARNIGGMYINEKYADDAIEGYEVVPKELQKRSMQYLLEMTDDMSWLDNKELNKDMIDVVSMGDYAQQTLIGVVMNAPRMMFVSQDKTPDPYTQEEAYRDIYNHILKDVKAGRISAKENILSQQVLLANVLQGSNVFTSSRGIVADSRQSMSLNPSMYGFVRIARKHPEFARMYAESMMPGRTQGMEPMQGVEFGIENNVDYILYGMLLDIQSVYRQALARTSDPELINHYKYMLLAIEKALKID